MISRVSCARLTGTLVVLLGLACSGCSPSTPTEGAKTEDQARDAKKIEELAKQGYDLKEIRAIMNGEQPPPRAKKKAGGGKR